MPSFYNNVAYCRIFSGTDDALISMDTVIQHCVHTGTGTLIGELNIVLSSWWNVKNDVKHSHNCKIKCNTKLSSVFLDLMHSYKVNKNDIRPVRKRQMNYHVMTKYFKKLCTEQVEVYPSINAFKKTGVESILPHRTHQDSYLHSTVNDGQCISTASNNAAKQLQSNSA